MSGRIPQSFIDELLNRIDIVDVINNRVALRKKGKEYMACCPFHNEKTPSFTVSQSKQFYHCFGCDAHGTAIGFVMEYDRLDFVDAIETLAGEYHMEVPREDSHRPQDDNRSDIYELLNQAARLYQQQLKQSPRAIDYLKQRGLTGETAKLYGLGYAPDSWDFIAQNLGKDQASVKNLLAAGLLIEKNSTRHYDRFRDRVMFPIRDRRGRVIGFGGRILDRGEPKYLNSPETPVFHKGTELYGLYEARQAVRNLSRILVVEGYMDVVALGQHGIPWAVATLGTATSQEQVSRLLRIVPEVIFCFDGDRAGREAAWRALNNALPVLHDGVQVRFLFLPEGEDPDSLVRKEGAAAFEERLKQALPASDFMFRQFLSQVDISSSEGKARLKQLAMPLIEKIQPGVYRELLTEQLSRHIGIAAGKLDKPPAQPRPQTAGGTREHRYHVKITPSRQAIALLLQYPELAAQISVDESLGQSSLPGAGLLFEIWQAITTDNITQPSVIIERWRGHEEENALVRLMAWDIPGSDDVNQRTKLLEDALHSLLRQYRKQRSDELRGRDIKQLSEAEKAELRALLAAPKA